MTFFIFYVIIYIEKKKYKEIGVPAYECSATRMEVYNELKRAKKI